jgi:hypothetical protein
VRYGNCTKGQNACKDTDVINVKDEIEHHSMRLGDDPDIIERPPHQPAAAAPKFA